MSSSIAWPPNSTNPSSRRHELKSTTTRILVPHLLDPILILRDFLLNFISFSGLRTLVFSETKLSQEDFDAWYHEFHLAQTAMINRREKIEKAAELIERNLQIQGATGIDIFENLSCIHSLILFVIAIEDRLQVNVPETLQDLMRVKKKAFCCCRSLY